MKTAAAKWLSSPKNSWLRLAMSPKKAGQKERKRPEQGAAEIVEQEARVGHAGLAGDRSGNCGEAGDELGEEQGFGATATEVALGFGYAR